MTVLGQSLNGPLIIMTMHQGKLIVLEGTDGSGKGTQQALLAKRLIAEGLSVETISFPQYGTKSCGPVEEYLNGGYGALKEVSPYIASLLYMIDRFGARKKIQQWLDAGLFVLSDRYSTSNMGHQGAQIQDPEARKQFWDWLHIMEFDVFANPRPDMVFILHIPFDVSLQLIEQKKQRSYITGGKKKDLLESDTEHLRLAEQAYLEIARSEQNAVLIECAPNGVLLDIETIHDILYARVKNLFSDE